jgi:predicted Zn-dependent protease
VLLERDRKWDEAAAAYRRAVESQPALRLARFNLARMLIAAGQNDEAIAELERVRTPEDKESPRYVFALATAHLRAGRRDLGVQYAHEARRLAVAYGQPELAAAIDKDLAAIGSR